MKIQTESLGYVALDIDNKDTVERTLFPEKNEESAMSVSKSKRLSHTATTVTTDKERSSSNNGSLVQTTISTLFKKAEEKVRSYNLFGRLSTKWLTLFHFSSSKTVFIVKGTEGFLICFEKVLLGSLSLSLSVARVGAF